MSEKEELVKQYFTKSDIKPKAIEENALEILKMRYFSVKADGNKEENFSELCRRVARTMASAETLYYNDIDSIKNVENSIYIDMMEHKFLFNSPALFSSGAGQSLSKKYSEKLYKDINQMSFDDYKYLYDNKSKNQMLFACFVIGVPDSLEGIFDSVKNAAIISKYGGGVGANFSCLREKTSDISGGTGGKASGPISFMETWNTMGSVVVQGGKRRAALMGMLNSNHPDIEDFINAKTEDGKLQYFNISVAIDNQFMDAVINDKEYNLISPQDNKVVKTVKARELWDKICNNAHKRGDPGIFFVDLANHDSLLQGLGDYIIHSTNPCLAGNTKILMEDGTTKEIKDIRVGDLVETYDTTWHQNRSEKVIFSSKTKENAEVLEIAFGCSKYGIVKVIMTPDHKVYTMNRGYVEAQNLKTDDEILFLNYFGSLISSNKLEKKIDVYDITTESNHNFFANGILVHNCGEQPLSNDTSCNLGSINLAEFVTNGTFDYSLFRDMVARGIYYLDLVIDATCYPLDIIEKKTKAIRPVGLGVMGLADAAILLGLKYGSKEFFEFSKTIASIMAGESLYMTYLIGSKLKEPFEMWNATTDMSGEDNVKDLIQSYAYTTEEIKEYSECIDLLNIFIERTNKSVAKSDKLWTLKNALEYLVNLTYNEKFEVEDLVALFNCLFYIDSKSGLRNSRRLSIAPTGTISLILNTSSSIEPNFAYEWDRLVTINEKEKRTLKYYHRYNNEENKNKGLLISAHEVTPLEHVEVVKCFAPYIDSAISKTVNLPFEATVDQVKEVYEECYKNKIKGITIYRDGSRSEQPLQKKEEKKEEVKTVINEEPITVKTIVKVKDRPQFIAGVTTKSDSPFGSIYVTSNFDNDGMPFEIFVSAGKSGSISKSITEALSRVISLALRAGVNIDDIIKTMNNISGSEAWVYDSLDGKELIVRSIPDAISKMLKDLIDYHKLEGIEIKKLPIKKEDYNSHEVLCPECGNQMVMISGCSCCTSCGFSPCK